MTEKCPKCHRIQCLCSGLVPIEGWCDLCGYPENNGQTHKQDSEHGLICNVDSRAAKAVTEKTEIGAVKRYFANNIPAETVVLASDFDAVVEQRDRLLVELEEAKRRSFQDSRICYRGFSYGVGSQWGIDSLRSAIKENGHG